MSKERKTLKVLSLLLWVLSVVMIGASIHGFTKGIVGVALSLLVVGIAGLFYGKKGIVGANTPSKVNLLPTMSVWLGIIVVVWLVLVAIGFVPTPPHPRMMATILFVIAAIILFAMSHFSKRVSEQVSL